MAEQTHDIWNDDDGEAEAKKARRPRRFLRFFLILAVVLAVVLVAAYRDGTGFDVLRRFFGEVKFYTLHPEYKCNCSRHYIEGLLSGMGAEELRSIIAEQGKIEVHCHYCNTDYIFTPEEAERLAGGRT